jgi:hypothetical protein
MGTKGYRNIRLDVDDSRQKAFVDVLTVFRTFVRNPPPASGLVLGFVQKEDMLWHKAIFPGP